MRLWIPFFFIFGLLFGESYNIPKKIWQTYRTRELPGEARNAQASWLELNPHYEYHFWDDAEIERYIQKSWSADTHRFFQAMPVGVMKADLWRCLIIADQGGVYSDIDTVCCLPIDYWMDFVGSLQEIKAGGAILLLGIENDDDRKIIDFCQWTFMATAKHPALQFACEYIVENWCKHGIDLSCREVVHLTAGPTILKQALMTYFGEPISMRASDLYRKYRTDPAVREKLARLGVYLLPKVFFSGFASVHLVASTNFGEGYVRWPDEVKRIRKE